MIVITGLSIPVLDGCKNISINGSTSVPPAKPTASNLAVSSAVNAGSSDQTSNNVFSKTSFGLPSSFQTYQDVWNSMGSYLTHHTSVEVWIPTLKGLPHFDHEPWMDVQCSVSKTDYALTVSVGPKMPPNSSKIIVGNSDMIYSITAMNENEPVPQNINWDNTSASIPNIKTQTVSLGHGVAGTMYTGKLDGIDRRDIVWKQDGWTFGWESEADESVKTTIYV